ncbi:MAG: choice-of-anchor tandem repeat NxxGxxAF-containing protein [Phycisphaerales bacterium]
MNRVTTVSTLLALVGLASTAIANPAGVQVVASTGTQTANGTMSAFFALPSINGAGQVACFAFCQGTLLGDRDNVVQFRGVPGLITEISRKGDAAPGGNGMVDGPNLPCINDSGVMAGKMFYTGTSSGEDDDSGVAIGSGGALTQVIRQGQPMPDNNGTFNFIDGVHIGTTGQATFYASAINAMPSFVNGIYRGNGGPIATLIRSGFPAPGGPGTIRYVSQNLAINADGHVAVFAGLEGPLDQFHDTGYFRTDGVTTVKIAREGELSPDGNGQLYEGIGLSHSVSINASGAVAFRSSLLGTAGGTSDDAAIFRGTGGTLTKIAREGQAAPGGDGFISGLSAPSLLDNGTAVFTADLSGTSDGTNNDRIFLSGNGGSLTTIARDGQTAPGGDGQFNMGSFSHWASNAAGEMLVLVELKNTQSAGDFENAIYFYRPGQPLREIARTGTPMLGSTVKSVFAASNFDSPQISPVNAAGQIAFQFDLADGREGIARFTPPPACLGDFNNDGQRNTLDLTMFLGKFGQIVPLWGIGDMNGDGAVNTLDLTAFLGVFGVACR